MAELNQYLGGVPMAGERDPLTYREVHFTLAKTAVKCLIAVASTASVKRIYAFWGKCFPQTDVWS